MTLPITAVNAQLPPEIYRYRKVPMNPRYPACLPGPQHRPVPLRRTDLERHCHHDDRHSPRRMHPAERHDRPTWGVYTPGSYRTEAYLGTLHASDTDNLWHVRATDERHASFADAVRTLRLLPPGRATRPRHVVGLPPAGRPGPCSSLTSRPPGSPAPSPSKSLRSMAAARAVWAPSRPSARDPRLHMTAHPRTVSGTRGRWRLDCGVGADEREIVRRRLSPGGDVPVHRRRPRSGTLPPGLPRAPGRGTDGGSTCRLRRRLLGFGGAPHPPQSAAVTRWPLHCRCRDLCPGRRGADAVPGGLKQAGTEQRLRLSLDGGNLFEVLDRE